MFFFCFFFLLSLLRFDILFSLITPMLSSSGTGSNSHSSQSPYDPHLQALLEEKNRLLKKLQDKSNARLSGSIVDTSGITAARALAAAHHSSQQQSQQEKQQQAREAGFNVYISGANEQRVQDQRKRELKMRGMKRI